MAGTTGKPGFFRGVMGRIGDAIALGNNYNRQTGAWTATPGQWIGGIGSRALNVVAPGLGTVANTIGNGLYGSGPLRGVLDANGNGLGGSESPQIGGVQRETIGLQPGRVQPNLGFGSAGVSFGGMPASSPGWSSPNQLG